MRSFFNFAALLLNLFAGLRPLPAIGGVLALGLLPLAVFAAQLRCAECGKNIPPKSQYYTVQGRVFCSQSCYKKFFEKTLPKCATCGKSCNGGFQSNGKYYCSQECLSKIWPVCSLCGKRVPKGALMGEGGASKFFCEDCAKLPRCFACQMPSKGIELPDGRHLCYSCQETAVADQALASRTMDEVRARMDEVFGLNTKHKIVLHLSDSNELKRNSANYSPGLELGLFCYKATIETVTTVRSNAIGKKKSSETQSSVTEQQYSIYVLDNIPKDKLCEVLAHELAHDWMQEYYPNISDLKIKEGWAEYVAAQMNKSAGREEFNRRMEKNPDPNYGDGYRMIRDYVAKHGFTKLSDLFMEYNKTPQ
ncbi:MAG: hypothetical protein A2X49_10510 [Lentisphaerae bacterium GWF2_52_8]|nr:MAG: hypothetical protein A2X49_10510 [Lentisphaerae bacterium GWF2_52_8]